MFNDSFLIVEVSPANNELSVPLNKGVSVRFAMDMSEDTITNGTLLLHIVNGASVPCTVTYDHLSRTAHIQPNALLTKGTQYRFTVLGGETGVKNAIGSTLDQSRNYEFTTTGEVLITAPTNLVANVTGQRVAISWSQPDQYEPLDIPKYEVYVSTSNLDPEADSGAVIWPLATDSLAPITQTSIAVGRDLSSANYYIYVRGIDKKQKGAWVSTQIYIAPPVLGGGSGGSTATFDIHETYPKVDAVNMMPTTIKILFTQPIDMTTITNQTVYILKKDKPLSPLNAIDLLTEFAPGNDVAYTIDPATNPNLLSLTITQPPVTTPPTTAFDKNTEYTVVIRETIKNTSGDELGEAYSWSFTTTYDPFFGDPSEVKEDVKGFLSGIPDKTLYDYMYRVSVDAYAIAQRVGVGRLANGTIGIFNSETFLANPPRYMGQYVRVKAAYELLITAFLEKSSSAGSVRTLGELTIDNSKSPDITKILAAFKDRIKPWEDELHGQHNRGYAKPTTAIKGEIGAPYPTELTRAFKDIQA